MKDSTIKYYEIRLKKMDIKDYKNYDKILKKLEFIGKYETRKQACSAILYHLRSRNTESPIIPRVQEYLQSLNNKLKEARKKNEFSKQSDADNFMNWEDILTMRDSITDPLEKLVISLYTYSPPRRRRDYFNFYYLDSSNLGVDNETEDILKNYITNDKKLIFNDYKTKTKYGRQEFDCPDEIYNQVIALGYRNKQKIFNLTQDCDMSKFVTGVFEKYCKKHMTIAR